MAKSNTQLKAEAANTAIEVMGGPTKAARKLTHLLGENISRERVVKWRENGVTPQYIPAVHQLSHVPVYELDPVVYPMWLFDVA